MSKILQKGETGFGILIEEDAGYVDKNLNKDLLVEGVLSIDPNQPIIINCILQKWGVENKNGRIYPKEVLLPQIDNYQKIIDMNSAVSEADHPDSSVVSLHNISHLIKKMWWGNGDDENILYGQLELITSPAYMERGEPFMIGDKVAEYLKRGIRLGISSRGVGSLKEINGKNIVQDDFELICFDLVASPSTPGAYLFPEKNEINMQGESIYKPNKTIITNNWGGNNKKTIKEELNKKEKLTKAINLFLD
jgi:hypothetical protein